MASAPTSIDPNPLVIDPALSAPTVVRFAIVVLLACVAVEIVMACALDHVGVPATVAPVSVSVWPLATVAPALNVPSSDSTSVVPVIACRDDVPLDTVRPDVDVIPGADMA